MRGGLELRRLGFASLLFLSLIGKARATPVQSLDFTIHQNYVSTRALGMGNAFTAVADDYSAIFYNPATLAFRTDSQLRMFIRAGADSNAMKIKGQLNDVKNEPEADQAQGYSDLLVSHYGQDYTIRAPTIGAAYVRNGWGLAFIPADVSVELTVHRQVGPSLNVNSYLDSTLAYSYAHKLKWFGKEHQLSWGATFKAVHRIYVGQSISAGQLADGSDPFSTSEANEGMTGDVDLGTFWKPPVGGFLRYMQPSFAIVGHNLIDYGFKTNFHLVSPDSGQPPNLVRRVDFGSRWDLPAFWVFNPHLAADVRDVGYPGWTFVKGSHLGLEFAWREFSWWKGYWSAGLNQGYWTAGFGARFAWFQLDLASYGEEMGTPAVPNEDRRYMVEAALDF